MYIIELILVLHEINIQFELVCLYTRVLILYTLYEIFMNKKKLTFYASNPVTYKW